jgi:hypothetical protein
MIGEGAVVDGAVDEDPDGVEVTRVGNEADDTDVGRAGDDEEGTSRLLKTFSREEPPQYCVLLPLQRLLHSLAVAGTDPAFS